MSDDWLDQLRQLHDADKAKRQAETDKESQQKKEEQRRQQQAINLLQQSQAHELLRQVQKAYLGGGGTLNISNQVGNFERVITLSWQGPISAAHRPAPETEDDVSYITVGVRQGELWVNDKHVSPPKPEALKTALLEACQNPRQRKNQ